MQGRHYDRIASSIIKVIKCSCKINQYLTDSNLASMNFTLPSPIWIKYSIIFYFQFTCLLLFCCLENGFGNNLKLTSDVWQLKKKLLEGTTVGSHFLETLLILNS